MKESVVVYTASIGRRMAPQRAWPGHDMVCFSDVRPSDPWRWVPITPQGDPTRQTRRIKILPWEHFDGFDACVWVDANIRLIRLPDLPADFAAHTHRDRDCIFDEAEKCIEHSKDDPAVIRAHIARYADHPAHWGLWETQMLYRRNTPVVRALCEDWWRELDAGSRRDQLSLPVVLRRHGIQPVSLGPSVWRGSRWCKRFRK